MTKNSDILAKICADKIEYIADQKSKVSESVLISQITADSNRPSFVGNILEKYNEGKIALIAEVKKASPSKGLIREDFDPIAIACSYKAAGAACLSVLTDFQYFQGRDEYVEQITQYVDLPILRKDFMLDPYQIIESKALGASCVLLIMAALGDKQAIELEQVALEYKMDVLVEVHTREELDRALKLQSRLIGINNRNLKTLAVDLMNFENLSQYLSDEYILVCESGIYTNSDIVRMKQSGAKAFLVGESLMRQDDIEQATKILLGN